MVECGVMSEILTPIVSWHLLYSLDFLNFEEFLWKKLTFHIICIVFYLPNSNK
jgi:hypothetical protein